ncbi:hypothetical protein OG585_06360 [Streptomyces sp. NBC_01340]|uniref:hypothetical protein n=1 Tax=unclassified Streptomyces TaxID=2593676 RepID=UPI0022511CEA|nr:MULTISPECIES: hypothetical protein [unclassified Streptomyces]MCX4452280.1 hypothetical protein [Streptomyces sp. NBC_01719]MCX4491640.1 hypothetical protein [Streptomyces sp. NBC_01728]MCX4593785.1 hypothetical protein [Streptomyces sp. NBC_01549]WSI44016.1 hypothetical protein OG585_06360 [Streptomyces sp. NBC_01340]
MFGRLREIWHRKATVAVEGAEVRRPAKRRPEKRTHNLFEAAAAYVSACAEDDQEQIDEAAAWVSPEALSFGVNELACRAVIALARERDESPRTVARTLLGLPAA